MIALILIIFGLAPVHADEIRMNVNEQRRLLFSPLATLTHSSLKLENLAPTDITESATGVEVGIRIYSISILSQKVFAGFDIRQRLAEREMYETKAGIHLEYRMTPKWGFQGGWSFGDTIVLRSRDLQFNGTSATFGFSHHFQRFQLFAEYSIGRFAEGPGFIYITRLSGPQRLSPQTVAIGIEVPLETLFTPLDSGSPEARVRPTLDFNPYSGTP